MFYIYFFFTTSLYLSRFFKYSYFVHSFRFAWQPRDFLVGILKTYSIHYKCSLNFLSEYYNRNEKIFVSIGFRYFPHVCFILLRLLNIFHYIIYLLNTIQRVYTDTGFNRIIDKYSILIIFFVQCGKIDLHSLASTPHFNKLIIKVYNEAY